MPSGVLLAGIKPRHNFSYQATRSIPVTTRIEATIFLKTLCSILACNFDPSKIPTSKNGVRYNTNLITSAVMRPLNPYRIRR